MIKWLFTLAIVVLALMLWFGKGRGRGAAGRGTEAAERKPPGPKAMVSCEHCGLHLPLSDAVEGDRGRHYCSSEHRRLGPGPAGRG